LSTSLIQPTPDISWKQEVNRRIAEHKSRKGLTLTGPVVVEPRQTASGRAAEARARVAARYAQAPTFSEMQAAEARTALRAAEIATQVALEAQATARAALEGFDASNSESFRWEQETPRPASTNRRFVEVREPVKEPQDSSVAVMAALEHEPQMTAAAAPREEEVVSVPLEDGWDQPAWEEAMRDYEAAEAPAPVVAIPANLIEFPRELVAPRKARPRHAENPRAAAPAAQQLNIFEVDPCIIAVEPEASTAPVAAAAPVWEEFGWAGIELEEQPLPEVHPEAEREIELELQPAVAPAVQTALEPASFSRRLLATVTDAALVAGATLGAVTAALAIIDPLPSPRMVEVGAAAGFFMVGLLYKVFFVGLVQATPGMRYARIALCSFDGGRTTGLQRSGRLGAQLLSLLPAGLGIVWAAFDEEHLMWHDRLSKTYLQKR